MVNAISFIVSWLLLIIAICFVLACVQIVEIHKTASLIIWAIFPFLAGWLSRPEPLPHEEWYPKWLIAQKIRSRLTNLKMLRAFLTMVECLLSFGIICNSEKIHDRMQAFVFGGVPAHWYSQVFGMLIILSMLFMLPVWPGVVWTCFSPTLDALEHEASKIDNANKD